MKKVVSLALSALLALSLAACSSSNTTSTAASSAATSDAASSEESTSDSSTSTASSAADNATAEPDIQFDESFQPQTIADNDTCTIILQNVGYDDSYGYYWTVDFQNKTDDKTLCAITSSSSLNGIPADTSWFPEIGPGVKTTEVVSWDKAGLEIYGVKPQDIDTLKNPHADIFIRMGTIKERSRRNQISAAHTYISYISYHIQFARMYKAKLWQNSGKVMA